ncbi:MAG: radical SAM protein [bacterium]|nr:radical SAM protein [Candidatus Sumerlaeota bacterium]
MNVLLLSLFDEWCLGLRSISSVFRKAGHRVTMAHLRGMPELNGDAGKDDARGYHVPPASVTGADFDALCALAARTQPRIIGVSVSFSNLYGLAAETTRRLRASAPEALIIWGGADATANPDLAAEHADIVCIGEGEEAVAELLDRLSYANSGQRVRHQAAWTDVANLWVRHDGGLVKNSVRPLARDLDALPWPDFDGDGKYWISGGAARHKDLPPGSHLLHNHPVMATRGCPYSCSFCCNSLYREIYGSRDYVRHRSVRNVIGEICEHLRTRPHIQSIEFHDDVFGLRREWLEDFAQLYPARVGLPFFCYTYPSVCGPEFVALIKKAGAGVVAMGLQSGSERVLRDIYGRSGSRDKVIRACSLLQQAGIPLVLDLIGSNPFETEEDRMATLKLLLDLPPGSFITHETNQLAFYRNYPISRMAGQRHCLNPWLPGRNLTLAEQTDEYRFWNALYQLPQFPAFGRDVVLKMAADDTMRQHPEIVESVVAALVEATFLPGTRMYRHDHAVKLAGELSRLKGSRAVQFYLRLKKLLGKSRSLPITT